MGDEWIKVPVADARDDPARGPGFKIQNVWVFVAVDKETGAEGVIGTSQVVAGMPMMMPLVATDERRRDQFRELAIKVGRQQRTAVRLLQFGGRREVETVYSPGGKSS